MASKERVAAVNETAHLQHFPAGEQAIAFYDPPKVSDRAFWGALYALSRTGNLAAVMKTMGH